MDWMALAEHLGGVKGDVSWWQMPIRAVVVFAYGLILVRFPGQRIFGQSGALDIVLAVLVGSSLSRALTGNAPFVATLLATTAIVLVHWLVAHLATRWHAVSWLVKGTVARIVTDGRADRALMRRFGLSDGDLEEAMRQFGIDRLDKVKAAHLERSGKISIVPRS